MSDPQERKIQLGVDVDATGARAGFDAIKGDAREMAGAVVQSGKLAGAGLDAIGAGGEAAVGKLDKATRNIISSIQRTTAAMETGSRSNADYFKSLAEQRGANVNALKPYLDQLELVPLRLDAATRAQARFADDDAFQRKLRDASALNRASEYVRFWSESLEDAERAQARMVEEESFQRKLRDAAALNKASDYVRFWTDSLEQAEAAERRLASQSSFLDDLQRQTAALGKSRADLLELKAAEIGVTDQAAPMIARMREAEQSVSRVGMSAKQTSAALRGVPAQITDIVVSLQSGQSPITVLLQQGGQLKDMFGGVGPAIRAVGGYALGLVNPFTVAAGAAAVLAVAAYQGSKETEAFGRNIINTGNRAGTSVGQLTAMARALDDVAGVTHGAAAAGLDAISATGKVSLAVMQDVTQAAVGLERVGGAALEKTVEQFAALGDDPVKAVIKLNEQAGFLTFTLYQQIKALQDQGKESEAAALAQRAYADTINERIPDLVRNLGALERGWLAVKGGAAEAWDAMKGVGRADTVTDKLERAAAGLQRAKADMARAQQFIANRGPGSVPDQYDREDLAYFQRAIDSKQEQVRLLRLQVQGEQDVGNAKRRSIELEEARIKWAESGEKYLSKQVKLEQEITKARTEGAAAGATEVEIAARIAQIRSRGAGSDSKGRSDAYRASVQEQQSLQQLEEDQLRSHLARIESERSRGLVSELQALEASLAAQRDALTRQIQLAEQKAKLAIGRGDKSDTAKYRGEAEKLARELAEAERAAGDRRLQIARQADEQIFKVRIDTLRAQGRLVEAAGLDFTAQYNQRILDAVRDGNDALVAAYGDLGSAMLGNAEFEELKRQSEAVFAEMAEQIAGVRAAAGEGGIVEGLQLQQAETDIRSRYLPVLQELEQRLQAVAEATQNADQRKVVADFGRHFQQQATELNPVWERAATDMEKTFRNTFVRLRDKEGDAWKAYTKSLSKTFQTEVADSIYRMFVQPITVRLLASISGQGGSGGLFDSLGTSGGGGFDFSSLSSWISAGKSLWSGFSAGGFSGAMGQVGGMFGMATQTAWSGAAAGTINNSAAFLAHQGATTAAATGSTASVSGAGSLASAWPLAVLAGMKMSADAYDAGFRDPKHSTFGNGAGGAIGKAIHDTSAGPLFGNVLAKLFGEKTAGVITGGPLVSMLMSKITGETRGGGQYGYAFDGQTLVNNRRGTAVTNPTRGVNYLEGPSGGELAGTAVREGISNTVTGINALLKSLGSSASLIGFQSGLETSDKGRGGVFSGGTLSTGATFGESGKGSNYDGSLYERTSSQSVNGEQALSNFADDLLQVTIQALQAATDIPQSIKDQLAKVDAEGLTGDAAKALLASITEQIAVVAQFREVVAGMPFAYLKGVSFDTASSLTKLAGGMDKFGGALSSYNDNFFTEAERTKAQTERLAAQFAELGIKTLPTTRDAYRALVEDAASGTKLATEEGRKFYLSLLDLNDEFAQLVPAAKGAASAMELAQQRREMEIELLEAQGKSHAVLIARRQMELEALDASLRPLQEAIYAAQDLAVVQERLAAATKAAKDGQQGLLDRYAAPLTVDSAYAQIKAQFAGVGSLESLIKAGPDALKASVVQLVSAIDPATASGQDLIAVLQRMTGAFDVVIGASAAAQQKAQAAASQAAADGLASAYQGLQDAVAADRNAATAGYNSAVEETRRQIDGLSKSVDRLRGLSDMLRGTVSGMRLDSNLAGDRAVAQAQLTTALTIARAGGPLPTAESLKSALDVLAKPSAQLYESFEDYASDYYRAAGQMSDLADLTDKQLSVQERTVKALESQLETMRRSHEAELGRLDGILTSAKGQMDALNGINNTVKGLTGSLGAFNSAIKVSQASQIIAALGTAPTDSAIVDALKKGQSLGLTAADLVSAWNAANPNSKTTAKDIEAWARARGIPGFAAGGSHVGGLRLVGERGPELEVTGPARYFSANQTQHLLAPKQDPELLAEIRKLRELVEELKRSNHRGATASEKSADLLNRISGGGGPLLTKAVT